MHPAAPHLLPNGSADALVGSKRGVGGDGGGVCGVLPPRGRPGEACSVEGMTYLLPIAINRQRPPRTNYTRSE